MPRYKITVEYDGSCFHGWQRQPSSRTVQGTLEKALKTFLKKDILVEGAGRTDAGVHALAQVAHLDIDQDMQPYRLCDALNFYLRKKDDTQGVVVLKAERVPDDFHARFTATGRVYEYRIVNRRSSLILQAKHAWHVIGALDITQMQAAANHLLGYHDFTSFRATLCQAPSPFKTVEIFQLLQKECDIIATIRSRSFLHNQVRIMMGTLKMVGEGRLKADDIPNILATKKRCAGGVTAPPQGLYLKEIYYN